MTESARMLDTREDFRVDVAQEGEVSVVSVGGDVDLHSAPVLRVRLQRSPTRTPVTWSSTSRTRRSWTPWPSA